MIVVWIISFLIVTIIFLLVIVRIILTRHQRKKYDIISSVTSLSRGESSEQDLIYRLIKAGIPASTIFHDLYIPTKHGHTQIDLVVPTNIGIFVFEVKDYSGWIFGNGKHNKWTQVLAYGQEKYHFYNPIKQNAKHIEALRNTSEQLQNVPIYSMVVFYGSCKLKNITNVPANCCVIYSRNVGRVVKDIMACSSPARFTDKWEIMHILKSGVDNGDNEAIKTAHLQKMQRAKYGKNQSLYKYIRTAIEITKASSNSSLKL